MTAGFYLALAIQKKGLALHDFSLIVAAGYLRGIPRDPSGEPFIVAPDGRAALGPKTRIDLGLVQ